MSPYVQIDNKEKDILILGKGPTQEIDDTRLSTEAINLKFCLRLHYNGSNIFLFVNATNIYQFKAKDSEIKKYILCV